MYISMQFYLTFPHAPSSPFNLIFIPVTIIKYLWNFFHAATIIMHHLAAESEIVGNKVPQHRSLIVSIFKWICIMWHYMGHNFTCAYLTFIMTLQLILPSITKSSRITVNTAYMYHFTSTYPTLWYSCILFYRRRLVIHKQWYSRISVILVLVFIKFGHNYLILL